MNSQSQAAFNIDVAPALKLYLDNIESLMDSCRTVLESSDPRPVTGRNPFAESSNQALASWQASCGELYERFIDEQIALCRFLGHRWERCRGLSRQVGDCRDPAELARLQFDFLTRMMTEYMQETMKLMQPVNDMMRKHATGEAAF